MKRFYLAVLTAGVLLSGCSESSITETEHDATINHTAVAPTYKSLDEHLANLVAVTRTALSSEGEGGLV